MDSHQPIYKTMPSLDDQEELLSSTEVDESLMGDEKQWHSRELESGKRTKKNKYVSAFKSCWRLIDTLMLLVIIGLLLLLRSKSVESSSNKWQVGGDFTGAGPILPTKIEKFEPDMSFVPMNTSEFFTNKTLDRWNSMLPVGMGSRKPHETFFTTSMTHQLHCVYMMARIFSGVVSDNYADIPEDYHFHFLHCIDYVRQTIMCSADLALEAHEESDSNDFGPLDGGWSAHHVCKDYSKVMSYLEEQIVDGARLVLPIDD